MSSELTIDPFVVGMLLTEQISLIATGKPIRGPRSTPDFNNLSIAIALLIAFFSSMKMKAFNLSFTAFILFK